MNAVLMNLLLTGAAKGNHGYRSAAFGYLKATISTKDVGGYTTFAASKPGQLNGYRRVLPPSRDPRTPRTICRPTVLPSVRAALLAMVSTRLSPRRPPEEPD